MSSEVMFIDLYSFSSTVFKLHDWNVLYVSEFTDVIFRYLFSASADKGLFDDIQEDEIEVLQQMFFGVVLCALATLAAKGDLVFTSIFMGAVAAMAGYWLSDKSDRVIDSILKGR